MSVVRSVIGMPGVSRQTFSRKCRAGWMYINSDTISSQSLSILSKVQSSLLSMSSTARMAPLLS